MFICRVVPLQRPQIFLLFDCGISLMLARVFWMDGVNWFIIGTIIQVSFKIAIINRSILKFHFYMLLAHLTFMVPISLFVAIFIWVFLAWVNYSQAFQLHVSEIGIYLQEFLLSINRLFYFSLPLWNDTNMC